MPKKFYFQLDADGTITDALSYACEGYVEVTLQVDHLPVGICGGWYKLTGSTITIDETKKPVPPVSEEYVIQLETRLQLAEAALNDLIMGV